ncbi:protein phosphatase 2C domain-containing protein [Desulfococcaceae bacterium HSG9]|nr:protein phosphatase 2C domain-containing protein [Desulfococcaceae bacterium HSG9]
MAIIESAGITDVGRKRKVNEDSLFLDDKMGLYIVADGMGGHRGGEFASKIVVDTIPEYMSQKNDSIPNSEALHNYPESISEESKKLLEAITCANEKVYRNSKEKQELSGMGSTVSAICFTDDTFIAGNVGDSHIYLVHDSGIELLSVIHNVITEQTAIDPERAKRLGKRFKHMLTRAVGVEASVNADISESQFFKNDQLILCSDGLSDKVSSEEILDVAMRESPGKACQTLVNMANDRGGDDNVTVIVLKIISVETAKSGVVSKLLQFFKYIGFLPKKILN